MASITHFLSIIVEIEQRSALRDSLFERHPPGESEEQVHAHDAAGRESLCTANPQRGGGKTGGRILLGARHKRAGILLDGRG
jgi:hypothetical protein